MNTDRIVRSTFDHEGYVKAMKERWLHKGDDRFYCTKHKTKFLYHENTEGSEPCWQCYDEFMITEEFNNEFEGK